MDQPGRQRYCRRLLPSKVNPLKNAFFFATDSLGLLFLELDNIMERILFRCPGSNQKQPLHQSLLSHQTPSTKTVISPRRTWLLVDRRLDWWVCCVESCCFKGLVWIRTRQKDNYRSQDHSKIITGWLTWFLSASFANKTFRLYT